MTELWTLLNFVDPEAYGDMGSFLERYGDIKSKERIDELHESIRPYILRRLKEDVEKSVPPKEETLIEVELTVLQKKYYRALYEKNVQFLHKNKKKALDGPSLNNLAMQLRKCCNHPFLLRGVEEEIREQEAKSSEKVMEGDFLAKASGKLVLLDKLLPRLKDNGHRVLIFSQFKIMLDILEDYLSARKMKFERIDGSITGSKRQMSIDRFQSAPSEGRETPFVMLLSTRAGGVGINLTAADTCIIFDSGSYLWSLSCRVFPLFPTYPASACVVTRRLEPSKRSTSAGSLSSYWTDEKRQSLQIAYPQNIRNADVPHELSQDGFGPSGFARL
jgi:chromodomain-helicase-DNA-binding protein 7